MNDLERLAEAIRNELPSAEVEFVAKSSTLDGSGAGAWLDVEHAGRSIAVEWRPGIGFGVSVLPDQDEDSLGGLFEGPDEVFASWHEARDHVVSVAKGDSRKLRQVVAR